MLALSILAVAAPAGGIDLDLWARVLRVHTREVPDVAGVRVDYAGLRGGRDWRRLVESLEGSDPDALDSREERLAFWINAYNILAIDVVLGEYPVDGIREIGSLLRPVWKRPAGRVDGRRVTLHEIEHEILRPMGEPRIHGAIVCASLSCPPLLREPYRAGRIDAQLDASVRRWLADPRKGVRIEREAGTLHLSAIFDWFEEDFGGRAGVLDFVAHHVPEEDAAWIRARRGDLDIEHLDYDWSLNDVATAPRSSR